MLFLWNRFILKITGLKNDSDSDDLRSDSEDDPKVIPNTEYIKLKTSFDILEKETEKVDEKLEVLEKKFSELQKQYEECQIDSDEVKQLRTLNRQYQEKFLELQTMQSKFFMWFFFSF